VLANCPLQQDTGGHRGRVEPGFHAQQGSREHPRIPPITVRTSLGVEGSRVQISPARQVNSLVGADFGFSYPYRRITFDDHRDDHARGKCSLTLALSLWQDQGPEVDRRDLQGGRPRGFTGISGPYAVSAQLLARAPVAPARLRRHCVQAHQAGPDKSLILPSSTSLIAAQSAAKTSSDGAHSTSGCNAPQKGAERLAGPLSSPLLHPSQERAPVVVVNPDMERVR
jgi:hypothetical protein